MKRYKIEIIVEEGNDEFWEELTAKGNTGCDEVLASIRDLFDADGWEPEVRLVEYTDAK